MGVKNFFCILLTRPQKHALSEFQLFTATRRFSPFNHNVGLAHPCHVTLILSSGQPDPNSLPVQNRKERGSPQAHLFTSHTKTWSCWRVESAPTRAYVVSREWPHLTRVCQTHDSIPGWERCRRGYGILSCLPSCVWGWSLQFSNRNFQNTWSSISQPLHSNHMMVALNDSPSWLNLVL